ncbi:DNA adenine methylase [Pontibacter sp. 172403-2]|uniref:DNA adenine methylase n=1 Tax=Pontibacter rufus TaxID=2791028 RepID=UPI0018AF7F67|nr:DNA adenine methylase [Pontibacter sp. 172403-2]MBF9254226.1 DNA adenine methylase [Pontibacter sp. 172403-2]
MFYSPLRYPGGKNKLSNFVAKLCIDNNIHGHYIEPYAGGASVALFLLLEGYVEKITINDKDRSIFAFWHSVINETEKLCHLIDKTEICIETWAQQKAIQKEKETIDLLTLGFSTLFLNRTNRSGIITGGVIGGVNQNGKYKIDCRFNKKEIIARINQIAKNKRFINLYNIDAIELIDKIQSGITSTKEGYNTIFYFDPPYYLKGDSLYMNYYLHENHKEVSEKIKNINEIHWLVSYDDNINIENLYQKLPQKKYSFNHSAFSARDGKEILFFSSNLKQPLIENYNPTKFKIKRSKTKQYIEYKFR